MSFPRFVSAGEALTDFIRIDTDKWVSRAGGAPWNVARAMATLGIPSAFAGCVSEDRFGDELCELSSRAGLDSRFMQRADRPPLLAIVHETSPPQYFFVGAQSADLDFEPAQLPRDWIDHVEWVHCGGISLAREPLASNLVNMLNALRHAGKHISFDPNIRNVMGAAYLDTFHHIAALAALIKVSDEDLRGLFPNDKEEAALAKLRTLNARAPILLTRGAKGAELYVDERSFKQSAPRLDVIDTVGAGDASIGGFLFSLMTYPQNTWPEHLRFSVAAAGAACLAPGAAPPSLARVSQVLLTMQ